MEEGGEKSAAAAVLSDMQRTIYYYGHALARPLALSLARMPCLLNVTTHARTGNNGLSVYAYAHNRRSKQLGSEGKRSYYVRTYYRGYSDREASCETFSCAGKCEYTVPYT